MRVVGRKKVKEAAEYAALLSRTLPAVIRSEAENGRYIAMLEELDSKGNRMTAAERRMADRPQYAEYIRRTSGFFPRPPKRTATTGR